MRPRTEVSNLLLILLNFICITFEACASLCHTTKHGNKTYKVCEYRSPNDVRFNSVEIKIINIVLIIVLIRYIIRLFLAHLRVIPF